MDLIDPDLQFLVNLAKRNHNQHSVTSPFQSAFHHLVNPHRSSTAHLLNATYVTKSEIDQLASNLPPIHLLIQAINNHDDALVTAIINNNPTRDDAALRFYIYSAITVTPTPAYLLPYFQDALPAFFESFWATSVARSDTPLIAYLLDHPPSRQHFSHMMAAPL
jgi:hypothetical protein